MARHKQSKFGRGVDAARRRLSISGGRTRYYHSASYRELPQVEPGLFSLCVCRLKRCAAERETTTTPTQAHMYPELAHTHSPSAEHKQKCVSLFCCCSFDLVVFVFRLTRTRSLVTTNDTDFIKAVILCLMFLFIVIICIFILSCQPMLIYWCAGSELTHGQFSGGREGARAAEGVLCGADGGPAQSQ